MTGTEKLHAGAIGGALVLYGIQRRARTQRRNLYEKDVSNGEGIFEIDFGVIILLTALHS